MDNTLTEKPFNLLPFLLGTTMAFSSNGAGVKTTSGDFNDMNNVRDQRANSLTAGDQARGSAGDVEITRQLRQALNESDSFSTSAKNVKIITLNRIVTLRGPVNSLEEKNNIAALAQKTAGTKKVRNELEVVPQ